MALSRGAYVLRVSLRVADLGGPRDVLRCAEDRSKLRGRTHTADAGAGTRDPGRAFHAYSVITPRPTSRTTSFAMPPTTGSDSSATTMPAPSASSSAACH